MQKENLEHLIRAAAGITNEYEFVVIGSQSILGSVDAPPPECLVSAEADIYALNAEHLSDLIDGSIGEGSMFHDAYDYYAQGVDSSTAVLPEGWFDRLVRLQSKNTNDRVAYCLDPTDLFLSKCVANREKDKIFNAALLRDGVVKADVAISRADKLPIDDARKQSVIGLIGRMQDSLEKNSLSAAENIAQQRGEFSLAETGDKKYEGQILGATDFHVIQSLGKSAVIHEKKNLDRIPQDGELVLVKYSNGKGGVEPRVKAPALGR